MNKRCFLLCSWALMLTVGFMRAALADGDVDPGFAPRIVKAGLVRTFAIQPDGKILIGGLFKTVNGVQRYGLARLNANGSLDTSFTPEETISFRHEGSGVSTIALQPDGRILVAGRFSDETYSLIRLNADGSLDRTFRRAALSTFTGFFLQPDGKILVLAPDGRVFRLRSDGTNDAFTYQGPTLGAGMVFNAAIAVQPDGKILVALLVINPIGTTIRPFLRVNADGSPDPTFNPGAALDGGSGSISEITLLPDGKIIISGNFTVYNRTAVSGPVRLNPDGSLDPSFVMQVQGVKALLPQTDGRIMVAGEFTSFGGAPRKNLARANADGSPDTSFDPGAGTNRPIIELARQSDDKILAGGNFYRAGDELHVGLARFHTDGRIDTNFKPAVGGRTTVEFAALSPGGRIVIAGNFDIVNETARPKLARLNADGTLDNSFAPQTGSIRETEGEFYKLAVQPDSKVLAYSVSERKFLRLNADGTQDPSFNAPSVTVIILDGLITLQVDGKILLPGAITSDPSVGLIRLNPNGVEDATFRPPAGLGRIQLVAERPDGKIVILAIKDTINSANRLVIARLNADGIQESIIESDLAAEASIRTLSLQQDGKILIGGEATRPDSSRQRVVIRLNSDGSPDPTFNTAFLGPYFNNFDYFFIRLVLAQPDGKILVSTEGADALVRLNANGSRDSSFNFNLYPLTPNTPESIKVLLLQPDGQLLIGGEYDRIGFPPGTVQTALVRIRLSAASVATTVSAANYATTVAPDSIASIFGTGIAGSTQAAATQPLPATLDGVVVKIRDSVGSEWSAQLFFISPTQINLQIPAATVPGTAAFSIELIGSKLGAGTVNIARVSPGLFTVNANGKGVPTGYALRVRGNTQVREPIHQPGPDKRFEPRQIDLGPDGEQIWLVLFGTGIRGRSALSGVTATIGGLDAMVGYAGAQSQFAGLDQINLLAPHSLAGRGEVDLVITVEGKPANTVRVSFR